MAEKSEVYIWLKSLSPSMKLERLLPEFENRISLKKITGLREIRGFGLVFPVS